MNLCQSFAGPCWGTAGSCPGVRESQASLAPLATKPSPRPRAHACSHHTVPAAHPPSIESILSKDMVYASLIESTEALPANLPETKGGQGYGTRRRGEQRSWKGQDCHSHLDILDPIAIGIIITLVPHAVVISIFLPRIGCQKAIVLKVRGGRGQTGYGLPQPGHSPQPACPPAPPLPQPGRLPLTQPGCLPTCLTPAPAWALTPACPPASPLPAYLPAPHLFAMLVVVHARQGLVRVAIDVCVSPTHIPIPGPAHVTLGNRKGRNEGQGRHLTPSLFLLQPPFSPTSSWAPSHAGPHPRP